MSKRYGLIVETKTEGPLIWESRPMTRYRATEQMHRIKEYSSVIRAAVFEMSFEYGNETLIPEDEE